MVHGKNRIPYWIDRRWTGLAGPDYDATISFGLPFKLGDCLYGKSRLGSSAAASRTSSFPVTTSAMSRVRYSRRSSI